MGLCALYYVEYSLYNVKKSGIFLSGLELHFKLYNVTNCSHLSIYNNPIDSIDMTSKKTSDEIVLIKSSTPSKLFSSRIYITMMIFFIKNHNHFVLS